MESQTTWTQNEEKEICGGFCLMKLLEYERHLVMSEAVHGLSMGFGRISNCSTDSHGLEQEK